MSKPRAGLVAVTCKEKVYAVGGNSMNAEPEIGQQHLDRVEVFDSVTASWTLGVPLPAAVQGPGVARGGRQDLRRDWDRRRRPPARLQCVRSRYRRLVAAAAHSHAALRSGLFGRGTQDLRLWRLGADQRPYHTEVEVYDIDAGTWSSETPMPVKKAWMATANVGERIFVMGGAHKWEDREGYNWIADLHEYVP